MSLHLSLVCDGCPSKFAVAGVSHIYSLRVQAEKTGWMTAQDGLDYCPTCAKVKTAATAKAAES